MKYISTKCIYCILIQYILLILIIGFFQNVVFAQGFSVKPMQIPITARPGSTSVQQIDLGSLRSNGNTTVKLYPAIISQDPQGVQYEVKEKNIPQLSDFQRSRSCAGWITLNTQTVNLRPMETKSVTAKIKIPQSARGLYYAGITAVEEQAGTGQFAINVNWIFLPTVLLTIQGPPAKQKISLTKSDMQMIPASKKEPASTSTSLTISNQGETFARIRGTAIISYLNGDKWRRITQTEIKERGILPGITLSPSVDIKRALPAGRYRISGQLYVDGRPGGKLDQEIDYAGDPSVTTLATDASMSVDPSEITVKAAPGSTRSGIVTISNSGDDNLGITCNIIKPLELQNTSGIENNADSFSCAQWIKATPESFTLRAGRKQSIRLSAVYPDYVTALPNYYARLIFKAAYPDGRNAGETESLVIIENSKVAKEPNAAPVRMNLKQQDNSTYIVTARFANSGNTHYTPTVTASVNTNTGSQITSAPLESTKKMVLPLSEPEYSGSIDFSKVQAGIYSLRAVMLYGNNKSVTQTLPIKVEQKDSETIVSIIEKAPAKTKPSIIVPAAGKKKK